MFLENRFEIFVLRTSATEASGMRIVANVDDDKSNRLLIGAEFATTLRAELMLAPGEFIGQIQCATKLKITGLGRIHHFI